MSGNKEPISGQGQVSHAHAGQAAQDSEIGADQRRDRFIEKTLGEILGRLSAQPDAYILDRGEYTLLDRYRTRFSESDIVRRAIERCEAIYGVSSKQTLVESRSQIGSDESKSTGTRQSKSFAKDAKTGSVGIGAKSKAQQPPEFAQPRSSSTREGFYGKREGVRTVITQDDKTNYSARYSTQRPPPLDSSPAVIRQRRIMLAQQMEEYSSSEESEYEFDDEQERRQSHPSARAFMPPLRLPDKSEKDKNRRPTLNHARTTSWTGPRPQQRPVIIDSRHQHTGNKTECHDPNCSTCAPKAGRAPHRTETLDGRSARSDPTPYRASPTSFEAGATRASHIGYSTGPAIIQPAKSRRRPTSSARSRPIPHDAHSLHHWPESQPPAPPPYIDRGPPISASAYSTHYYPPDSNAYYQAMAHAPSRPYVTFRRNQRDDDHQASHDEEQEFSQSRRARRPSVIGSTHSDKDSKPRQYNLTRRPSITRSPELQRRLDAKGLTSWPRGLAIYSEGPPRPPTRPIDEYDRSFPARAGPQREIVQHGSGYWSSENSDLDTSDIGGSESNEIRLRVDNNAPLSLSFDGDMEGRTLRVIPGENGMSELVIGRAEDVDQMKGKRRSNFSNAKARKLREIEAHSVTEREVLRRRRTSQDDISKSNISPKEKDIARSGSNVARGKKTQLSQVPQKSEGSPTLVSSEHDVPEDQDKEGLGGDETSSIKLSKTLSERCSVPGCEAVFEGEDGKGQLAHHLVDAHIQSHISGAEKGSLLERKRAASEARHGQTSIAAAKAVALVDDLSDPEDLISLGPQTRVETNEKSKNPKEARNSKQNHDVTIKDPNGKILRVVKARTDTGNPEGTPLQEDTQAGTNEDSVPMESAITPWPDLWAEIRKDAVERATKIDDERVDHSRNPSESQRPDQDENSSHETIEDRVARIKTRVAELTGQEANVLPRDYTDIQRPRHDSSGISNQDDGRPNPINEVLNQGAQVVLLNEQLETQRKNRKMYLNSFREPPDEPPAQIVTADADHLPQVSRVIQKDTDDCRLLESRSSIESDTMFPNHAIESRSVKEDATTEASPANNSGKSNMEQSTSTQEGNLLLESTISQIEHQTVEDAGGERDRILSQERTDTVDNTAFISMERPITQGDHDDGILNSDLADSIVPQDKNAQDPAVPRSTTALNEAEPFVDDGGSPFGLPLVPKEDSMIAVQHADHKHKDLENWLMLATSSKNTESTNDIADARMSLLLEPSLRQQVRQAAIDHPKQLHDDKLDIHQSKWENVMQQDPAAEMEASLPLIFPAPSATSSRSASVISVFSVASLATSASDLSKASGYSATQIATATKVLISVFEEDEVLLPLYQCAIESPLIGPDRLQRNLRRLFKAYAEFLANEAKDQLEYLASKLVSLKSRWLAQTIVEKFRIIEQDRSVVTPAFNLDREDESSDEENETHPVSEEVFGDLIIFREFLIGSDAIKVFRTQLRSFVFPKTVEPSSQELQNPEEAPEEQPSPLTSPVDTNTQDKGRLRFWARRQEDITKYTDVLLIVVGLVEPPLAAGRTRLRWRCNCGERLMSDVTELREGGVKELVSKMKQHSGIKVVASTSSNRQYIVPQPSRWLQSVRAKFTSTFTNSSKSQPCLPQHNTPCPSTTSTASQTTLSSPSVLHLLACMHHNRFRKVLHQDRIETIDTDRALLCFMRQQYKRHRGHLKRLLSLKSIQGIFFIKFRLPLGGSVDVRHHDPCCVSAITQSGCECIPPKEKVEPSPTAEYRCVPGPPATYPPVPPEYLRSIFTCPNDVDEKDTWILNQLPKRTCGQLKGQIGEPADGWGIYYDEGFDGELIAWFAALIFVLASFLFATLWWQLHFDMQGAFGASAYFATLCSIVISLIALRAGKAK